MKTFYEIYNIPDDYKQYSFIVSVKNQFEGGKTLSEKQILTINDIIGVKDDVTKLLNDPLSEETLVFKNYNYCDSYGDYMIQSNVHNILSMMSEEEMAEEITSINAANHGCNFQLRKYEIRHNINYPTLEVKYPKTFIQYGYYTLYEKAIAKLKRDRFRTVSNYNKTARLCYSMLKCEVISEADINFINNTKTFKH